MADRINLCVRGSDGYFLEDPAAELVGGLAVSHKHRMAFGRVSPVPFHQPVVWGEGPPQVGVACIVYLENQEEELRVASRQYGWFRPDRISRYLVMGPVGSWVGLFSATLGLSIGFWPVVHAISKNGSALGLAFLMAWSIFYIPVIARAITGVWHRQWALSLAAGVLLCITVFWLGDGVTYVADSIRDIWEKLEHLVR